MSELAGLYALVAAIYAMVEYSCIEGGSVVLACDNLGAIKTTSYNAADTNPASCKHFDLVICYPKNEVGKNSVEPPTCRWAYG
jgi:hypothetical protein